MQPTSARLQVPLLTRPSAVLAPALKDMLPSSGEGDSLGPHHSAPHVSFVPPLSSTEIQAILFACFLILPAIPIHFVSSAVSFVPLLLRTLRFLLRSPWNTNLNRALRKDAVPVSLSSVEKGTPV